MKHTCGINHMFHTHKVSKLNYTLSTDRNLVTTTHGDCKIIAIWNNREGWGELTVLSAYGNYAYRWEDTGGSFGEVLVGSYDHLMDMLLSGHDEARTIKPQETIAHILAELRHIALPFRSLSGCETEKDFHNWANHYKIPDVEQYFIYGYGGRSEELMMHVLPPNS